MFIKKKAYNKRLKPIYIKQPPKKLEVTLTDVSEPVAQVAKAKAEVEPKKEKVEPVKEKTETTTKKRQNKKVTKKKDMADPKLKQVEELLDKAGVPERKVKIEKKEKGLYERTENSTILLTEDNKMVLND